VRPLRSLSCVAVSPWGQQPSRAGKPDRSGSSS
jgi:hypothetical protein